jgi:hypothetical protein
MKTLICGLLLLASVATPCRAAGLQVSIQDGKVTIDAQDVTIRQILAEWARVGKTRIINAERIIGGPVTIKLDGVPEKQALEILLRAVPGYMAAPRETFVANASLYETILIMPTTTAVAVAAVRTPGPVFGGGPANMTQLRQPLPLMPGALPEIPGPPDPQDDPAIAAAAAAGLITVPAAAPGPTSVSAPLTLPGGVSSSSPTTATPANPWNAPAGTPQPSLAPPPAPTPTQPIMRPRPPQADR